MRPSLFVLNDSETTASRSPKPAWLKVRAPGGEAYRTLKARSRRLSLSTVCEQAQCPNIGECWAGGTATFMLMGDTCTRGCRFCAVETKRLPPPLDLDEPEHIADAIAEMGLVYAVITSVNRDDVHDGGASHLARCMERIRAKNPDVLLELLIPDFAGSHEALRTLDAADLAVVAHNIETVERLTPHVRDRRATYAQSLDVLRFLKALQPARLTKSSIMLGLGESEAEVRGAMHDLRAVGVDILTLGQYLRPSMKHLPVAEFVSPERFLALEDEARALGFGFVAAGPLVRSSYRAAELFVTRRLGGNRT